MILLIDNYDSFSYNLYQLVGSINRDIKVVRNDELSVGEIKKLSPEYIILSPGPKTPAQAGVCVDTVKAMGGISKILGVCLGHQSICAAYGAKIGYAKKLMHGKQSDCFLDNSQPIFKGLENKIKVGRYHSLAVVPETLPDCLKVIAKDENGAIMAVRHKTLSVYGFQFHPESILTPNGKTMIENFLGGKEND
ncbi:MAG: aminodeoxychorismate/anthranilate synthase component II [Clostridiales bacterium]|nr:aminodeoxychorismate/anthranilate synthase component II [Clostridiales bacterium]